MNNNQATSILSSLSFRICSGTNIILFEDQRPHARLLPELIYGKVQVKDVERFLGEEGL
jgi:hypothetical protein